MDIYKYIYVYIHIYRERDRPAKVEGDGPAFHTAAKTHTRTHGHVLDDKETKRADKGGDVVGPVGRVKARVVGVQDTVGELHVREVVWIWMRVCLSVVVRMQPTVRCNRRTRARKETRSKQRHVHKRE